MSVNWMRLTPYASSGTFTSRVFDAGSVTGWGAATWNADMPSGTTQVVSVRTGNSPTPDATWSSFSPLASPGASVGANARYLQYRVVSTTSDSSVTPTLRDISFQVSSGPPPPDTTPPTITAVNAAPGANGTSATITWTTNEPSSSRVDYGTSAASLNLTTNDAALVTSHSVTLNTLTPGTAYFFRVRSTDAATNEATSPVTANPPATLHHGQPRHDPADDHRRERGSGRQRDLGHDHLDDERALELARGLRDLGRVAEPDHQRCGPGDLALGHAEHPDAGHGLLLPGPLDRRGHQRGDLAGGGQPAGELHHGQPRHDPADDHRRERGSGRQRTSATITWTTNEPRARAWTTGPRPRR